MLSKLGSKFRHRGGGYQKRPKSSDVFYGRPQSGILYTGVCHNSYSNMRILSKTLELNTLYFVNTSFGESLQLL